jgi:hypothetical protein
MLIRIWIETTRPLAGSAATDAGDPLHFDGWLELLTVVSDQASADVDQQTGTSRREVQATARCRGRS